jgi:hypothetical protein
MTRKHTTFVINPPTWPKRNKVPYEGFATTIRPVGTLVERSGSHRAVLIGG